jgi:dipeptidase E
MFKKAAERGAVLAGGSAGAICWFEGGHSDSGDPDSYRVPPPPPPESSAPPPEKKQRRESPAEKISGEAAEKDSKKAWEYVRVPGLGLFPGLCCPHHDKVQSNGVLRAVDFEGMMKRHHGEVTTSCFPNTFPPFSSLFPPPVFSIPPPYSPHACLPCAHPCILKI